jgi:SepF-like predicted cell division protein (DUF552 family)
MKKKRTRNIPLYVYVTEPEHGQIQQRMAEAGTINMSAFIRKMALSGYVLHVDITPVRELISLQRRCADNMNQIAASVNTYGGITPQQITTLQDDYKALWKPLGDLINLLAEVVTM